MLQRYNITRDDRTNRVSIKEFAVLETKSYKRVDFQPTAEDYSLIHEVSFDHDTIRVAISEGQNALIDELRSGDFFPIYPCIVIIAEHVTALFNGNPKPSYEVYFDDRTILSTYEGE